MKKTTRKYTSWTQQYPQLAINWSGVSDFSFFLHIGGTRVGVIRSFWGGGHDRKLDGLEEDRIEGKGSIQLAVVKLERIPKTQGSEVPTIFAIPDETVCLEKG